MKKLACLTLILVVITDVSAQKIRHMGLPYQVRVNVQQGLLLPEYGFMSYLTDDYVRGFEINILHQTSGPSIWEHLYRYPGFGVSFHYTSLGSSAHFGRQFSLYPYYQLNIARCKRFEFSYQMGVGISYATKKYDPDANYQNLAIGSHFNVHYHADILAQYRVNEKLYLHAGINFSHISNANLSEPNVGINLSSFYIGAGYAFGKRDSFSSMIYNHYFEPFFTYELMLAGGMKHTRTFESFQYPALSVSFDAKRRFGYKFALGIGADFFYDSSTQPQMERLGKSFEPSNAYTSGIHITQEFIYDRFSLLLQEGFYLGLTDKLNGYRMYNRAMVRYKFCNHYFVNFSLKSHLYILDFPEFGIGYYW